MAPISVYLNANDVTVESTGEETILRLVPLSGEVIAADYTTTINILKSELVGIKIILNKENFSTIKPNADDISIIVDPSVMKNNALNDLFKNGNNLTLDKNSSMNPTFTRILLFNPNPSQEELVLLYQVQAGFGDVRYISVFDNEDDVKRELKLRLKNTISDKNTANADSMLNNNGEPIEFKFDMTPNDSTGGQKIDIVNNAITVLNSIFASKPENVKRFLPSNNYTLDLFGDLCDVGDNFSFVSEYISNPNQRDFNGNLIETNSLRSCIKIILT